MVQQVIQAFGGLDYLVNNAAAFPAEKNQSQAAI